MFNLRELFQFVWATLGAEVGEGGTQTDATYLKSSKWKSKLDVHLDFQDNFLCW